mgnify:CR=1 FL=1
MEIRKYDDSRGGFPDTKRGAIMLYHTWSEPIFPQLSATELMLLDPGEGRTGAGPPSFQLLGNFYFTRPGTFPAVVAFTWVNRRIIT